MNAEREEFGLVSRLAVPAKARAREDAIDHLLLASHVSPFILSNKANFWSLVVGPSRQLRTLDMTKIWAGPVVGWAYLVSVINCCTREIVSWNLSHRCRTEDALAAVEQAVLARPPSGSREASVTFTTDNVLTAEC